VHVNPKQRFRRASKSTPPVEQEISKLALQFNSALPQKVKTSR
jgi:hypothetical protein